MPKENRSCRLNQEGMQRVLGKGEISFDSSGVTLNHNLLGMSCKNLELNYYFTEVNRKQAYLLIRWFFSPKVVCFPSRNVMQSKGYILKRWDLVLAL